VYNKTSLRRKEINKRNLAVLLLMPMKIKKNSSNELKATSIFDINSLLTNDFNKKEVNKLQNSIIIKNRSANFKFIIIVF
jgi:hypothetical protein